MRGAPRASCVTPVRCGMPLAACVRTSRQPRLHCACAPLKRPPLCSCPSFLQAEASAAVPLPPHHLIHLAARVKFPSGRRRRAALSLLLRASWASFARPLLLRAATSLLSRTLGLFLRRARLMLRSSKASRMQTALSSHLPAPVAARVQAEGSCAFSLPAARPYGGPAVAPILCTAAAAAGFSSLPRRPESIRALLLDLGLGSLASLAARRRCRGRMRISGSGRQRAVTWVCAWRRRGCCFFSRLRRLRRCGVRGDACVRGGAKVASVRGASCGRESGAPITRRQRSGAPRSGPCVGSSQNRLRWLARSWPGPATVGPHQREGRRQRAAAVGSAAERWLGSNGLRSLSPDHDSAVRMLRRQAGTPDKSTRGVSACRA